MTTDDAPRPALDAASFRALVHTYGTAEYRLGFEDAKHRTMATDRDAVHYARAELLDAGKRLLAAAARADALAGEVARLRTALAFYADPETWLPPAIDAQGRAAEAPIDHDEGDLARAALAPAAGEGAGDGD